MALFTDVYDDAGGQAKRRFVPYPGFLDTSSVNGVEGAVNFPLSGVTLTATHAVDAYVDGRMQDEGVHYNRDVANNRLIFTGGVHLNSTVRIRVFLK